MYIRCMFLVLCFLPTYIFAGDFSNSSIAIDPGHGGSDPGTLGYGGNSPYERELVLDIALRLKNRLYQNNSNIILTRENAGSITGRGGINELNARVKYINQKKPKALISIHMNGHTDSNANGIETYYHSSGTNEDAKLAKYVQSELVSAIKKRDRGVKKARFTILGVSSTIPAVLAEVVFISNQSEYSFIKKDSNKNIVADALYNALKQFIPQSKDNAYIKKFYKRYSGYFGYESNGNYICYGQYIVTAFQISD